MRRRKEEAQLEAVTKKEKGNERVASSTTAA